MKLVNISNFKRTVNIFTRDDSGNLSITQDSSLYPYYYEPHKEGKYTAYDGQIVTKIVVAFPADVAKRRSPKSYEADILFTKRYILDKIDKFEKGPIKYFFLDIEVLAKDLPNPIKAKDTISCISIYNSLQENIQTWWLKDFESEGQLIDSFVKYIQTEQPDLILAWNVNFDFTYLCNRIKDFSMTISPIQQTRYGDVDNVSYPAGISILDYMGLFKKVYMREQSYALENIAQKYLGEPPRTTIDFSVLNDDIKEKNINDIHRLIKLEKKFKLIDYYDEIRRFAMCLWEDLPANSRVLDMIVLREAKKRNLILPTKKRRDPDEDSLLQGAYRRSEIGVFKDLYKADVASMYPNQLINFCLDTQNIRDKEETNTTMIDGVWIKQNPDTLLPYLSRMLIGQKDEIKKEYNRTNDPVILSKYNAIKGLVNSLYGVMAFPSFRLFNPVIASRITFLARDLLQYVENNMKDMGYEVIYTDTDALMYKASKDEIDLLNKLVVDWAIEHFEKPDININFESEGKFSKILILGKCHYFGYINKHSEEVEEIKGMAIKRSSSSRYEARFMKELIHKILDEVPKEDVLAWVGQEKANLNNNPLSELAFPAKIANRDYKNEPIFVRAYANTSTLAPDLKLSKGELFHYVFVKGLGKDEKKRKINVLVLTDKFPYIDYVVDWEEMARRNIDMKSDAIFEVLGWKTKVEGGESIVECI